MMMPRMTSSRSLIGFAALFAACAGVSPRPNAANADSLPSRTLSRSEAEQLRSIVEQAKEDIIRRRYDAAARGVEAALALDPRSARAHAIRGIVRLERARAQEPPDIFLQNSGEADTVIAEQLAPDDPLVAWTRAHFLAESGHLSAAAAAAEAGIQRAAGSPPDQLAALYGAAGTYRYELGEERTALPLLERYVELQPDDAAARFRMGNCLLRQAIVPLAAELTADAIAQGDAVRASRSFDACFELAPGDDDAALAAGAALVRAAELASKRVASGDRGLEPGAPDELLDQAMARFETVAERFPDNAEAVFRIGVVHEQREDAVAAATSYELALGRDPKHLGSLLNLAALRAESDPTTARELWRRALAADATLGGLTDRERRDLQARVDG